MSDITPEQRAQIARDAQVVRDHIPRGYLVTHRTANAVDLLLDALDAAEKERDEMHALLEAARQGRDAEFARANDNAMKLHATRRRAGRAEARVARVEALADRADSLAHLSGDSFGAVVGTDELRIALNDCEGVGTGADGGGDPASTEATSWVNRSADCPEDPAQAHPLADTRHEHDAAGCLECSCSWAPWAQVNGPRCTCADTPTIPEHVWDEEIRQSKGDA